MEKIVLENDSIDTDDLIFFKELVNIKKIFFFFFNKLIADIGISKLNGK